MHKEPHKESLKASDAWCKGARRELISRTSHKPIKVWFCSSNPTKSTIEEPSLLDAPAWPWILAAFLFLLCLVQLGERRESIRLNESLPKALEKAQIDAFRRKIGHSRHKVLHRRL